MSIADKLTTVAENVEKVYTAGYEKGKSEGGGNEVSDKIINNLSGIRFSSDDWVNGDTLELIMPNLAYLNSAFYFSFKKVKNLIITSETPILTTTDCFYVGDNSILEKVVFNVDFSKCPSFARWFMKHQKLKFIEGYPIDFSSATTIGSILNYCYYVESFRVVPKTIKVNVSFATNSYLDDMTIQSIIDGLADLTGETAKTITFHKDIKAKLTEEQIASITSKNWTLA